jgi:hypothetical protein
MKNGFYSVQYAGRGGNGMGMLVLRDGIIAGADVFGGKFDGTYVAGSPGNILATLKVELPAGATSALTGRSGMGPMVESWSTELPADLGTERRLTLKTSAGFPLEVLVKRVRDLES